MIKIGVADYGMMVWYGACYDYAAKMDDLKAIGYDGCERLYAKTSEEAYQKLLVLAERGMSFATVVTGDVEGNIKMTAAYGGKYIWADRLSNASNFDIYCRNVNYLEKTCLKYGIHPAIHNHLGSLVETEEQLDEFLARCKNTQLVFDTAHMAVAGGDVMRVLEKYYDRLAAVHVKDWFMTAPEKNVWNERGYFTGLGAGNFPVDNEGVVKTLIKRGYDKWIHVEHDTHLREPLLDLKQSREVLGSWGLN